MRDYCQCKNSGRTGGLSLLNGNLVGLCTPDAIEDVIVWAEDTVSTQPQLMKRQDLTQALAEEFSCPFSTVEQILDSEWHQLEQGARIKEFIPVLVVKQVKHLLRRSRQLPS